MENDKKYFFTTEGFEKLQEQYDYLINVKRGEVAEKIKAAREFGDLSENAEYDAAKDEQATVESEILQIEAQLANAEIVDSSEYDNKTVALGHKVKIKDLTYDESCVYYIVGSNEANIAENKIHYASPLAKAILGKKKGDTVEFLTPAGKNKIKILEILK